MLLYYSNMDQKDLETIWGGVHSASEGLAQCRRLRRSDYSLALRKANGKPRKTKAKLNLIDLLTYLPLIILLQWQTS